MLHLLDVGSRSLITKQFTPAFTRGALNLPETAVTAAAIYGVIVAAPCVIGAGSIGGVLASIVGLLTTF